MRDTLLLDAIPLPATLVDLQGTVVEVNESFLTYARSLGLAGRREEYLGRPVTDLAAGMENGHRINEILQEVLATAAPFRRRERYADRSGRAVYQEILGRVVRDEHGRATGALLLREEVTEAVYEQECQRLVGQVREQVWRMRHVEDVEQVLRAMQEGLRELGIPFGQCGVNVLEGEDGPATVRSLDRDGSGPHSARTASATRVLRQIWRSGVPAYRGDLERDDPFDERRRFADLFGEPVRSVVDVPFSHGTLAVNSTLPHAFSDRDLALLQAMAGVLTEGFSRLDDLRTLEARNRELERQVKARRRTRRALDESEQKYRAAVDAMEEMVHVVDPDLRLLFLNAAFHRRLAGMQWSGEPVGHTIFEVFPFLPLGVGEEYARVFATGQSLATEETNTVNGRRVDTETRKVPILEDGKVNRVLTVIRDVTVQRRLAEELREAQKLQAVGQLTAGVAHNFNNMLQGVLGNIQLAAMTAPAAGREFLADAEAACQRAADVVRQLLVYSRRGGQAAHGKVDLAQVVQDTITICRRTFGGRIQIRVEGSSDLPAVVGDATQLQQVLLNLCLNARDALEESGKPDCRLEIRTSRVEASPSASAEPRPGPYVLIEVEDNGTGIDPQIRDRVFEPFFTTKPVGQSAGLGLATALAIVTEHHGWLDCDSRPGEGTIFRLFLPATVLPTAMALAEAGVPAGGTEAVLLVDDEEPVRLTTARLLERHGYTVLTAASGQDGLELLRQTGNHIRLVLLDLSMPGASGTETLARLREISPALPVVLFTGYAIDRDQHHGVQGILRKPVRLRELLEAVRRVLDNGTV
ncbi:MAG: PAS domain-containing protein [Candidatus Latescibacterota bacterium]